ncbi:P-loop containing nucleoside triphosphate hydrolase protein [Fusarium flagelliforme]|uniref:P-loop containing nucleoside triphosphate hydrolase protein n=1 Tax=Fusarium flagelliforme TaxID=2675880 RepID=UPI001E8E628F|nr:P-loop containing nucleoside triphosphate hydrolase protein [Fusarium flagelliforme]KAH7182325.1 P-loop containing nucleoside triphosphate hydrolase protein [Fusarium flagelliforme]
MAEFEDSSYELPGKGTDLRNATSVSRCHGNGLRRRLPMMVDWRREICSFLNMTDACSDHDILDKLETTAERLEECKSLRSIALGQKGPPKVQVLHKIECQRSGDEWGLYVDEPWIVKGGPYQVHLRSSKEISNLDLHLEKNKDIVCIVYRVYQCCGDLPSASSPNQSGTSHDASVSSLIASENVSIVSDGLRAVWEGLIANGVGTSSASKVYDTQHTHHPYLWWFHHRQDIDLWTSRLDRESKKLIDAFRSYLNESLDTEWAAVDDLMSRGKITKQHLDYILIPGQIILSRSNGQNMTHFEAYTSTTWPNEGTIEAGHWKFDGNFQRFFTSLSIFPPNLATGEFPINNMLVYPSEYANDDAVIALRKRGEMFWRCRQRNYVRVVGTPGDHLHDAYSGSRFMVDTKTYIQMHPRSQQSPPPYRDDLGPEFMAQDDPHDDLGDEFFMCLPPTLNGFDMQKKEWVKLGVANITEVVWNDEAFDLLVMEPATKELVQAVVTNHVDENRNTDLIHGKGNGLFILLHGGPGTGKTLTAESVAEITKKPLYRVTCGDIGTKAEEVERYLEVVLLLGKTWDCVVLLDEADVFLEQRTLDNLDRNALVSVFLRVLEYYDGILILTSNRVGIFDEAFKSRIQLSLRYENLGETQRRKVWQNFINRLEKLEMDRGLVPTGPQRAPRYGVDIEGVRQHLDTLAKPSLNGREIRNTISTARQLATFREERLAYGHLEACIAESNKFDQYIKTLKHGFSADQIKKDQQER